MDIPNTDSVNYAFASAQSQAMQYRHEFITPEHLLSALLEQVPFQKALAECFCTPEELSQSISEYLSKEVERVPQEIEYELEISGQLSELLQYAYMTISHSSAEEMDVPHLVQGMLQLEVLDGSKCILRLRGVRPFMSDKYDLTQHPNYKYTADYDKRNEFNIEKFLSHRLKLKAGDEFEVVAME